MYATVIGLLQDYKQDHLRLCPLSALGFPVLAVVIIVTVLLKSSFSFFRLSFFKSWFLHNNGPRWLANINPHSHHDHCIACFKHGWQHSDDGNEVNKCTKMGINPALKCLKMYTKLNIILYFTRSYKHLHPKPLLWTPTYCLPREYILCKVDFHRDLY